MLNLIKQFFLSLIYIFFILIVLTIAGIIVLIPRISFYPPWPWWQCFALLAGVILFIGALWYTLKFLRQSNERKKLKAAAAEEKHEDSAAASSLRATRKWRSMLLSLRQSCLKHKGDPLYALPWFITLGDKGSGKSGLISGSRLLFDLQSNIEEEEDNEGGKFWFMKDMVMIEAPGVNSEEQEISEFHVLLNQIARNRKKEPVNGIILTLPVDMLREGSDEDLITRGREIRSQLEAIMLRFSTQIPVYIMINKIDLIPGIRELSTLLPETSLSQACGVVNEELAKPTMEFMEEAFSTILRQFKNLRLSMIFEAARKFPALMATPTELELLLQPLRVISKVLFQENPYQHTPLLRGIYLGSGNFANDIIQDHLNDIDVKCELIEKANTENMTQKPLFLHDFFSSILPQDRFFHKPLPEFIRLSALKRNTPALTLLCIGFSLILLLSAVFTKTALDYTDFRQEVLAQTINSKPIGLSDAIFELNKMNEMLKQFDSMRSSLWYSPVFLFFEAEKLDSDLQAIYKKRFVEQIQEPLDKLINQNYPPFAKNSTGETIGAYFEFLIRNINLSRAASSNSLREKDFEESNPAPTPNILYIVDSGVAQDIAPMLPALIKRYYLCANGDVRLRTKAEILTGELVTLLDRGPDSMLWLIDWAKTLPNVNDITLKDFWNNTFAGSSDADKYLQSSSISRAFTNAARVQVISLTNELLKAVNNSTMDPIQAKRIAAIIHDRAKIVFSIYKEQTYDAWITFASWLTRGRLLISSEDQLKDVAGRSAVLAGPYMNFLDKCQEELLAFAASDIKQLPPWMGLVLRIKELRTSVPLQSVLGSSASMASKAASWVSNIAGQIQGNTGVGIRPTTKLQPETIFMDYCKGLWKSGPAPGSAAREVAYKNLSALYTKEKAKFGAAPADGSSGDAKGGGDLPLDSAYTAYNNLKTSLGGDSASESDNIIWEVLRGPLDLVIEYNCFETGRLLESAWKAMVVNGIESIPEVSRPLIIFKQESGRVWKWLSGPANPFLALDASGDYFPVSVFGHTIPFKTDFINMLTDASKGAWGIKKQYAININALPIDVNPRALRLPNEVVLTLNTAAGPTSLKNLNYPVTKKFAWNPEEGGRTQLRIEFNGMSLLRTYEGPYGFARFIKDFSDGIHTFKPANFPNSERALEDMCVTYMDIKYFFDPSEIQPILLLNKVLDIQVPVQISDNFSSWRKELIRNDYAFYNNSSDSKDPAQQQSSKVAANKVTTSSQQPQQQSTQQEIEYVPAPAPAMPVQTQTVAATQPVQPVAPANTATTQPATSPSTTPQVVQPAAPVNNAAQNNSYNQTVNESIQLPRVTAEEECMLPVPPIPHSQVARRNTAAEPVRQNRPEGLNYSEIARISRQKRDEYKPANMRRTTDNDFDIDLNQDELDQLFAESNNLKSARENEVVYSANNDKPQQNHDSADNKTALLESLDDLRRPYSTSSNVRKPVYKPKISNNPFSADVPKTKATETGSTNTAVSNSAETDQEFDEAIAELDKFIIEQYKNDQQ